MPLNQLHIIPAELQHLAAIVAMDQRCLGGLWSLEAYQREIDSPNSDLFLLMSTASSPCADATTSPARLPLLGFACLWAILEEAHITILAIHPDHRRQGYGRLLLTALLSSAYDRGLEWATLEVRPSNVAAVGLYESFGFETVGRRRKYYQDNGEDALILWHKGLQTPEFQSKIQSWREASSACVIKTPLHQHGQGS